MNATALYTPKEIIRIVSARFGIGMGDIIGKSRSQSIFKARKEAAKRLRSDCGLSYPEIGKVLRRDHSTVMRMVKGK